MQRGKQYTFDIFCHKVQSIRYSTGFVLQLIHCLSQCYEKKGSDAAFAWDGDIQPWLHRFVKEVGYDKAQRLLSKAGDFVKLPTPHVTQ